MRPIFIFAAIATQFLLAGASLADNYDDCRQQCRFDQDTRNADCPSPYDSSDQVRAQCMKKSRDDFEACVKNCPAPSTPPPPPPSPPPQNQPAPSGGY